MGVYIKRMTLDEAKWLLGPTRDNEIVEIKAPHGRLIDADTEVSSDGRTVHSVCGYIAPTVIEAEVE